MRLDGNESFGESVMVAAQLSGFPLKAGMGVEGADVIRELGAQ